MTNTESTKLVDFVTAADCETDIEMYQGHETKTLIIEWDDEKRTVYGFDEEGLVYVGESLYKCGEALGLNADEMAGLAGSDATYMVRR